MNRIPLWILSLVFFILLFVLCVVIPVSFVAIDWVPEATPSQIFWGTLQAEGPVWAFLSLVGSGILTALFALHRRLLRRHP
jgi:hypothetical protein